MSNCNPELVSAYLDGELDAIILGTVTDHLLKCDHCRVLLSKLAQVHETVHGHLIFRDPEAFTGAVMAAIANERMIMLSGRVTSGLGRFFAH